MLAPDLYQKYRKGIQFPKLPVVKKPQPPVQPLPPEKQPPTPKSTPPTVLEKPKEKINLVL